MLKKMMKIIVNIFKSLDLKIIYIQKEKLV